MLQEKELDKVLDSFSKKDEEHDENTIVVKKRDGLFEKVHSSKTVLTENNKVLLKD